MSDHLVRIKLQGDAAQLESQMAKVADTSGDATASLKKAGKAADDNADAFKELSTAAKKASEAKEKAARAALALQKAVETAKGGTLSLGKAALAATATFGPWGIAIGVVGSALVDLVSYQDEAAAAAKRHAEALREEADAAREAQDAIMYRTARESTDRTRRATATKDLREERFEYEKQIAANEAAGLATGKLQVQVLELRARERDAIAEVTREDANRAAAEKRHGDAFALYAEARAISEEAMEIRRDAETTAIKANTVAQEQNLKAKRKHVEANKQITDSMQFSILGPNARGSLTSAMEDDMFERNLARGQMAQRVKGFKRGDQRVGSEEAFRVEIDRMMELEEIRANSAAAQKERHEEELRQLSEKQAAYQAHASTASSMALSILSISDARRNAVQAAKAQGKTDREAAREGKIAVLEQTAATLTSLRNMAIVKAIEQTALGIGALATYNYPSAGLHFAAAATWGAVGAGAGIGARMLSSRASNMRQDSSMSANGSSAYGGGSGTGGSSTRSGSSPSNVPGSGPAAPAVATNGGGPQRTVIYQIGEIHTYGTPRKEFLRQVDEGLSVDVGGNRRRRSGTDG